MSKKTVQGILDEIPIPPIKKCGEILDNKWFRLKSYYYILENSEKTNNAEETFSLINNKLVEIEDCHSGVAAVQDPELNYNGRMYPIQDDYVDRKEDGRIIALSKGNKIIIEPTGEFKILNRIDDSIILDKRYEE